MQALGFSKLGALLVVAVSILTASCSDYVHHDDIMRLERWSQDPARSHFAKYAIEPNSAVVRIQPLPSFGTEGVAGDICRSHPTISTLKFYEDLQSEKPLIVDGSTHGAVWSCAQFR